MHRTPNLRLSLGSICALASIVAAVTIGGCGNSQVESSGAGTPPPPPQAKTAAAGPAVSQPLAFDQVALESDVKRVTSKQGPVYLHFSYCDQDGRVYKCVMPEAMSKESRLPDEWLRVFAIYRLPEVVKKKAAPKNPLEKSVTDFPFISPRPSSTAQTSTQPGGQPGPMETPPAPPAPTAPANAPHSGGRGDLN